MGTVVRSCYQLRRKKTNENERQVATMGSNLETWFANAEFSVHPDDDDQNHYRSSSVVSPSFAASDHSQPSAQALQPPAEFLCPISWRLMSDPVRLLNDQTFDRSCILACIDLGVDPTSINQEYTSAPHLQPTANTPLIPNLALKSDILNWCNLYNVEPPPKIEHYAAIDLVCNLVETAAAASSSRIEEHEILGMLTSSEECDNIEAVLLLRQATKEHQHQRARLCTPIVLISLKRFLSSNNPILQFNAAAAIHNLSLDPANKVSIVQSGLVPAFISALDSHHRDLRSHAAAAFFSLSLADANKPVLGTLGALRPLLHLLSDPHDLTTTRRDAAVALYHLTTDGCASNKSDLLNLGAARVLTSVTREYDRNEDVETKRRLKKAVVGVSWNLATTSEGRAALMDSGAVESTIGMVKSSSSNEMVRQCLKILHRLTKEGRMFREVAAVAGVEEVLCVLMRNEEDGGAKSVKEMAMRIWKEMW